MKIAGIFVSIIKTILLIVTVLIATIAILGIIYDQLNPNVKGMSKVDFKDLGILFSISAPLFIIFNMIDKVIKSRSAKSDQDYVL